MILEVRKACIRYLYYGARYEIMMYFRYDYYMGVLLESLVSGYRELIEIKTWFSYVGL